MTHIVLVNGPPGSGKSPLCRALAASRSKGYYISVDAIREAMLGGFAFPDPPEPSPWSEQFALARQCAEFTALTYADAGVDVFIDDTIVPSNYREQFGSLCGDPRTTLVYLYPGPQEMMERLRLRNGEFDEFFLTYFADQTTETSSKQPCPRIAYFFETQRQQLIKTKTRP